MTKADKIYIVTQGLALAVLIGILKLHLLPTLIAGLLTYQLVERGAQSLERWGVIQKTGRLIFLVLLILFVVSGLATAIVYLGAHITEGPESLSALLQRMADVVDRGRSYLPPWVQTFLPANFHEWQVVASEWLRENARHFGEIGQEAGISFLHMVVGMIVGGMVAVNPAFQGRQTLLATGLKERASRLEDAFRRIVSSQVRISALNTLLTAVFLLIILPLTGNPLPMANMMVALTFFVGLLPIIGNLISNTVIFLVGLSVSPAVAVAALVFLIVIHKLEYFVNAHIIGSKIKARAWEILLTMLVMETAFGIVGLIAAPIYYAYLKDELIKEKLI